MECHVLSCQREGPSAINFSLELNTRPLALILLIVAIDEATVVKVVMVFFQGWVGYEDVLGVAPILFVMRWLKHQSILDHLSELLVKFCHQGLDQIGCFLFDFLADGFSFGHVCLEKFIESSLEEGESISDWHLKVVSIFILLVQLLQLFVVCAIGHFLKLRGHDAVLLAECDDFRKTTLRFTVHFPSILPCSWLRDRV